MPGMLSILLAHNYYRSYRPSGENVVFEAEAELLRDKGHTVYKDVRRRDDIANLSLAERAALSNLGARESALAHKDGRAPGSGRAARALGTVMPQRVARATNGLPDGLSHCIAP